MQTTRRPAFLRSLCLLVVSGAVILTAGPDARANTIAQSLDFRLNSAASSSVLHFAPFDPLLGTLDSVNITFDATRRHSWGIWNVSGASGAMPYEVTLTDTTFTIDGNLFGFSDLHYGPGSTPVLAPTGFPTFLQQFLAGQAQFLAGEEPDFGPHAFQSATTLSALTDSFAASSFTGVLNLAYAYDPGVFAIDSNGHFAGSLVDVFGDVTVSYGYTPHAVPETGVGAVTLTLLCLFGHSLRLRLVGRPSQSDSVGTSDPR